MVSRSISPMSTYANLDAWGDERNGRPHYFPQSALPSAPRLWFAVENVSADNWTSQLSATMANLWKESICRGEIEDRFASQFEGFSPSV